MIQYEHKDYDRYIDVQRKLTAKKTGYGNIYFSWCTEDMIVHVNELIHKYIDSIRSIVCHGCRCGTEVDVLQRLNPDVKVYGTDLYGEAYRFDRTYFMEMDFDIIPEEWIGYFDVVYSNSIDHSRNPINTLLAWKAELREGGICFVDFEWGRGVSREDCFHLDGIDYESEINDIADKVGMDVVYVSDPGIDAYGNSYADVIMVNP